LQVRFGLKIRVSAVQFCASAPRFFNRSLISRRPRR